LFSTLDSTKTLNKAGTGIGLYQSNKFAQKLGPDNSQGITVDSELGKGSTFSFILENKEIEVDELDEELPPIEINSRPIRMFA
jgi:signal transduction histidine kinase